jgi:ABC-type multidrug transport system fused ATPase/permease subunit
MCISLPQVLIYLQTLRALLYRWFSWCSKASPQENETPNSQTPELLASVTHEGDKDGDDTNRHVTQTPANGTDKEVTSAEEVTSAVPSGETGAGPGVGSPVATVLTWQGLSISAGRATLLNDISGYAQPGEVLAIMGESGEGLGFGIRFKGFGF